MNLRGVNCTFASILCGADQKDQNVFVRLQQRPVSGVVQEKASRKKATDIMRTLVAERNHGRYISHYWREEEKIIKSYKINILNNNNNNHHNNQGLRWGSSGAL